MRRRLEDIAISSEQRSAIIEAKRMIEKQFSVRQLIIFGSVARGEATEESDLDLMVITEEVLTHKDRNAIYDIIFEVNYKYATNLSAVVVDAFSWESGILTLTPIFSEVQRDGVIV